MSHHVLEIRRGDVVVVAGTQWHDADARDAMTGALSKLGVDFELCFVEASDFGIVALRAEPDRGAPYPLGMRRADL